ncbi:MAG: hypothetical protein HFF50_10625 [Lawsonibacter sp.]|nr:hypothetical protein [Lawsonibacter sp.]
MPSEKEFIMYQKSTIYDIIRLIKKDGDRTYTADELEALLNAYAEGLEQA